LLAGLEDGDGEAVGAEVGPDVLDRVQLRGIWREWQEGDVVGHAKGLRAMPSGSVQHGNGVRALGDGPGDLARWAFIAGVSALGMTGAAVTACSGQTAPKMQAHV